MFVVSLHAMFLSALRDHDTRNTIAASVMNRLMHIIRDRQSDGRWIARRTDGWMQKLKDRCTEGRMDAGMEGRMDEEMNRWRGEWTRG